MSIVRPMFVRRYDRPMVADADAQTLRIPFRLVGMNEIVALAKGAGGTGAGYSRAKRQQTQAVAALARAAKLRPVGRAFFEFIWVEKDRRRDPDNICGGGRKVVLDALVEAGLLGNDGWEQIAGWTDMFTVDKANPGVRVTLTER